MKTGDVAENKKLCRFNLSNMWKEQMSCKIYFQKNKISSVIWIHAAGPNGWLPKHLNTSGFGFPIKLPDPEVLWLARRASRIGSSSVQRPGGLRQGLWRRWSWAGRSSPQWPSQRDGGPVDNVLIWEKKKIWCLVFRKMFAITSQARPGNSKEGFILAVIVRPVSNMVRVK